MFAFECVDAIFWHLSVSSILCVHQSCLFILSLFVCVRSEKRGKKLCSFGLSCTQYTKLHSFSFRLCFGDRTFILGNCLISSPNDWYNVFIQFQSSISIYFGLFSDNMNVTSASSISICSCFQVSIYTPQL